MTAERRERWVRPVAGVTLVTFVASLGTPIVARAQTAERAAESPREMGTGQLDTATNLTPRKPVAAETVQQYAAELARTRRWLEELYARPSEEASPDLEATTKPDETLATAPSAEPGAPAPAAAAKKSIAPRPESETRTDEGLPTANASGVTGKTISVPKGEGTIQGMGESFSAQLSTGIATFNVPFALPKARGDAQPALGLSYSSSGAFGVAGVGWSIGVAFIARQTDRGTPKYNDQNSWQAEQDHFVFNGGQELVPVCVVAGGGVCAGTPAVSPAEQMPAWATGHQYFRPRVEGSFLRFFWSPDHRTWRVQAKSGVTMELGVPLDGSNDRTSLEENPNPSSPSKPEIFRWMLAREYDTFGTPNPASGNPAPLNLVRYRYLNDRGTAYLSDIYDTPPKLQAATAPVAQYAHHTRLVYESRTDPTHSYRSGWRIDDGLRLVGVDVASRTFVGTVSSPRELLRRYHLAYEAGSHASLLSSVTVEGRCAETGRPQITEDQGEHLPKSACPTLPPMGFTYSHVEGHLATGTTTSPPLAGYEAFDERVVSIADSPAYSLDEAQTTLEDINGDALPDVLVTAPGFFNGKHGLYLNGASNAAGRFAPSTIGVRGALGASENDITLGNLNVVPLDVDGDATVNLVHMPLVKRYAVYTPQLSGTQWWWEGRAVDTADALSPKIDLGRDASFIKVVDVNFDGLVDVVRTTGTEVQTYFALGRYPGGDGRFGHATRTGPSTATLSTDPVRTCVPWTGTAVSFGDKDTQLADMNGDGIVDIVRVRRGDMRYWPGRGNGFWGTGDRNDCAGGTFGQGRDVSMDKSPYYTDIQGDSLRLEDVNGDGLSDLVQVRFQDIDIWLNVDGLGWTQLHTISGTPASPSYANRVRLTDINGSGTPDILWGDSSRYQYIDLQGGARPWLLKRVENGLGKSTALDFGTSVSEMLTAKAAGKAWPKGMPIVSQVVKRVTVSDNLTVAGRGPAEDVTEYTYAEPIYDGRQREFRGFRRATARRVGDASSPAETTESKFLLGECGDETNDSTDDCSLSERWRDNPREALKGLPYLTERHDDSGVYQSTVNTLYRLRQLYLGLDGRRIRHAFAEQETTTLYDNSPFVPGLSTPSGTIVTLELAPSSTATTVLSEGIPQRATSGSVTIRKSSTVDYYGNTTLRRDSGCTSGGPCGEFTEDQYDAKQSALLLSGWLWRTETESVTGSAAAHSQPYNLTKHAYSSTGRLLSNTVSLMGTVELARNTSDSGGFPPRSTGTGAQPDATVLQSYVYDEFGNVSREAGANLRCRDITYDTTYSQLPVSETLFKGGCDSANPLVSKVDSYDRGLGVPIRLTDVAGQPTSVVFDGLGRVILLTKPDPSTPGSLSGQPSLKIEYFLPPASGPAHSLVHTSTQDGATPSDSSYLESWAYVDGLGRTVATAKEAEPEPGASSVSRWIVSGLTQYDDKSAVHEKFLEYFHSGNGNGLNFSAVPPSPPAAVQHDAFGRTTATTDYDGTTTLKSFYHALAVDQYDAEDLFGTDHVGTFFTELRDGHGRVVKTTERLKVGNGSDQRVTLTSFLPTGAPEIIRRTRTSTGEQTSRYLVYDTRARLVLNAEPSTTPGYALRSTPNLAATNASTYSAVNAWRYRYDDAGDMVGVSDARGCGANFFYDGLGRLLKEDYFPCETQHAAYSLPTPATGVPTSGVEVAYEYDALSSAPVPPGFAPEAKFLQGRLVRVRDQASHTLTQYDGRGRAIAMARQIARPGATADNVLANRYAPRWYQRGVVFDAADRPTADGTGADPSIAELLGPDGKSVVTTSYDERGSVKSVSSSYGTAANKALVRHVYRTADDLVTEVQYGDTGAASAGQTNSGTTTVFEFDPRRRLKTVMTYRGPAASWPANWETRAPETFQLLLENQAFAYDGVSNPITIQDLRTPSEWPAGAKPADRAIAYDDLYRATSIQYTYHLDTPGTVDTWVSPYQDELSSPAATVDSRRAQPTPQVTFPTRMTSQSFAYDWLGNTSASDDDLHGFYDRSLGTITNGSQSTAPYQMQRATAGGARGGTLRPTYDAAGNMSGLFVTRSGPCRPLLSGCSQSYRYEWDEVGRLSRARRWDSLLLNVDLPPPAILPAAVDLRYRYDGDDERVLKTATDALLQQRHTAYVFDSLEFRRTQYTGLGNAADYTLSAQTEVPYLFANGVRLARVVYEPSSAGVPLSSSVANQHVFFELGDHLGSTSVVLDKDTGELVERSTYQAYGAAESDYRPDRWDAFREDYRFTGKEEDVEVGLVYFGKRFLNPLLNRWISPDPLGLHDVGQGDLNLYAYVKGRALQATDPRGLEDTVSESTNELGGITTTSSSDEYTKTAPGQFTLSETSFEVGFGDTAEKRFDLVSGGAAPTDLARAGATPVEYDAAKTHQEAEDLGLHTGLDVAAGVALSATPVGDAMDAADALDQSLPARERWLAAGSFALGVGPLPNLRALKKLGKRDSEYLIRFGAEAEMKATKEAGKLAPHEGHRGPKGVAEPNADIDPVKLGHKKQYSHRVDIEVTPGTTSWLQQWKIEGEPGRYAIPAEVLEDFNARVRSVRTTKVR